MATITEMLTSAIADHQAGRREQAEEKYRAILQADPNQVDALHYLGVLCHETHRPAEAIELIGHAVQVEPGLADAHFNLGIILQSQGRTEEAIGSYRRGLRINPNLAEAHFNLGNALLNQNNLSEAETAFRHAIGLRPDYHKAYNNLAMVLQNQDRVNEEVALLEQAIRIRPNYASALSNLGNALQRLGKVDEAVAHCQKAVQLEPNNAQAHNNLGAALLEQGKPDEARETLETALRLKPDYAKAMNNYAAAMQDLDRLDESFSYYRNALELMPDYADAHVNHAMALLLAGDFELGWPEYEWRTKGKDFDKRPFPQPLWDGSPLEGRTILIQCEQGLGDTLHFIRYAPLVKERGGKVIVECQPALLPILASAAGIDQLVGKGSTLPAFDVRVHLLSLPGIFRTDLASIPAHVPYVQASDQLVEHWRRELAKIHGYRIGIAWQGNPKHKKDRQRSIRLAEFAPLAQVPGVQLLSLQKGNGVEQLADLPRLTPEARFEVVDLGSNLDESSGAFMDTAAVMKNLDLIITSDTATSHLAGALGVPVWVALSTVPDWRWLRGRADSPWYPTMRLWRQTKRGEWADVFDGMARELTQQLSQSHNHAVVVDIAPSELIDKITILQIKSERIKDAEKLRNIHVELASLSTARDRSIAASPKLDELAMELRVANEQLWDIEDAIRLCERDKDFGPHFIELARSVYRCNDQRAALKRRINELLGSAIVEEKSYADYQ